MNPRETAQSEDRRDAGAPWIGAELDGAQIWMTEEEILADLLYPEGGARRAWSNDGDAASR